MRFRLCTILLYLILAGESPHASPSARLKFDPDAWVKAKVDALVAAARAAYEQEYFAIDDANPGILKS